MRRIKEYKRLEDDRLQSKGNESSSAERVSAKALKGFKDTRARTAVGSGECDV